MAGHDFPLLAVDAHGGDHGPEVTVPAAVSALQQNGSIRILLVGNPEEIGERLKISPARVADRLEIVPADSVLANDAKPAAALRRGKGSSMWNAFSLVSEGRADACVSGGSTAAMMVLGVRLIGMLEGIQRPALMTQVPTMRGSTGLLDVGANVDPTAEQLVQFAVMGAEVTRESGTAPEPSVGLLNVGHEETKGHGRVRRAHEILGEMPLNYAGFIEGHDLFAGKVDVAVSDGFAGNLLLKASEGLAIMLLGDVRDAMRQSLASRLGGWLAGPSLRRLLARRDPSAHNGAPLLGLAGVAVKSHGGANRAAFTQAILEAGREARRNVPEKINNLIHRYHLETPT